MAKFDDLMKHEKEVVLSAQLALAAAAMARKKDTDELDPDDRFTDEVLRLWGKFADNPTMTAQKAIGEEVWQSRSFDAQAKERAEVIFLAFRFYRKMQFTA